MKVEILCSINSGQFDRGQVLDLPTDEAKVLIEAGAAKKLKKSLSLREKKVEEE